MFGFHVGVYTFSTTVSTDRVTSATTSQSTTTTFNTSKATTTSYTTSWTTSWTTSYTVTQGPSYNQTTYHFRDRWPDNYNSGTWAVWAGTQVGYSGADNVSVFVSGIYTYYRDYYVTTLPTNYRYYAIRRSYAASNSTSRTTSRTTSKSTTTTFATSRSTTTSWTTTFTTTFNTERVTDFYG